jgi:hypothetical protein
MAVAVCGAEIGIPNPGLLPQGPCPCIRQTPYIQPPIASSRSPQKDTKVFESIVPGLPRGCSKAGEN